MQEIHSEILRRFGRAREIILERDGWRCLHCGVTEGLTIDHIDGNGRNSTHPNNNLSNLQTLCRRCHGRKDGKRGGGNKGARWKFSRKVSRECLNCREVFTVWMCSPKIYCSKRCSALTKRNYKH